MHFHTPPHDVAPCSLHVRKTSPVALVAKLLLEIFKFPKDLAELLARNLRLGGDLHFCSLILRRSRAAICRVRRRSFCNRYPARWGGRRGDLRGDRNLLRSG